MRKTFTTYLFLLALLASAPFAVQSQTIFSEDFDNTGGTFPAGWKLFNLDGLTPAANVNYVDSAWIIRDDFITSQTDSCAFSTSWYNPVGTANDWMITPGISLAAAGYVLRWEAVAPDPTYPDGYEVRIGTAQTTTGQSTVLTSFTAENQTWTSRQVFIPASFHNQTVYISFRNNSNDKFLLMIDSIRVEVALNHDAKVTMTDQPHGEYTKIPFSESPTIDLGGEVTNIGLQSLSNVNLKCNVYNSSMALQTTATGTAVPTLASSGNTSFNLGTFTPPAADNYILEYVTTVNETDGNPSNDTSIVTFQADTVYARDDGIPNGTIGIGAGTHGQIGQIFTLQNPGLISSITFMLGNQGGGMSGQYIHGGVMNWDHTNHQPGSILAITDSVQWDTSTYSFMTLPLSGGAISLPADTFFVYMQERDSNITLARANDIYTMNTGWVDFPGNQFGGWATSEAYNFSQAYILRANMPEGCMAIDSMVITEPSCAGDQDGGAAVHITDGTGPYTYAWSTGDTTSSISGVGAGSYTLTIIDAAQCTLQLGSVVVSEPSPLAANMFKQNASCDTCTDGSATAVPIGGTGPYTYSWSTGDTSQTTSGLTLGMYICDITDSKGCTYTDSIEVGDALGIDDGFGPLKEVEVFPNPNHGQFTLNVTMDRVRDINLSIVDLNGKKVYDGKLEHAASYSKEIKIPGLSAGQYFLKLQTEEAARTVPMIIE